MEIAQTSSGAVRGSAAPSTACHQAGITKPNEVHQCNDQGSNLVRRRLLASLCPGMLFQGGYLDRTKTNRGCYKRKVRHRHRAESAPARTALFPPKGFGHQ